MSQPRINRFPATPRILSLAASVGALAAVAFAEPLSSHREAPFVTETPKVDATDFYMFNSYEADKGDFVTLIANYQPFQPAYGGPNFFTLDPEAYYDINVDNDGDAVADVTFRFRFQNTLQNLALQIGPEGNTKSVPVPLANLGTVNASDSSLQNVHETYTLDVIAKDGKKLKTSSVIRTTDGSKVFEKPLDNIGSNSVPGYEFYSATFEFGITLPDGSTGRVFVGQRKDPFVVNLGDVFDLVNTNPLGPEDGEPNALEDDNVTSLVLEIPKSFLVTQTAILGGWTTASLPGNRKLVKAPTFDDPSKEKGKYFQVSRLGNPLVNELVIGLRDKDLFNSSAPEDDAQFLDYVTNPTLPEILHQLFGVDAPTLFPRSDLVQVFLTGVTGLNSNGSTGEMLRLNTFMPAKPVAEQDHLGVIGGDNAGFPNGRRPGDDVVDIALRVVMGKLLSATDAPDGQLPYTDGAHVDATMFPDTFPYLNAPVPGSP